MESMRSVGGVLRETLPRSMTMNCTGLSKNSSSVPLADSASSSRLRLLLDNDDGRDCMSTPSTIVEHNWIGKEHNIRIQN